MAKLSTKQLAKAVVELIDTNRFSQARLSKMVAAYLIQERRSKDADALMREISEIQTASGRLEATATSAFKLSDEVRKQMQKLAKTTYPDAKKIMLHEVQDPAVLGGVRLEMPEKQLDLTIRSKLQKLKAAQV